MWIIFQVHLPLFIICLTWNDSKFNNFDFFLLFAKIKWTIKYLSWSIYSKKGMSSKCHEKYAKTFFSAETEMIKTMHIKKELNYWYWQLIVDSCLLTLFSMYKRDLKIKCKNSNILSDKDFRLTNVKIFNKIMKILRNICFSAKLFTTFIL